MVYQELFNYMKQEFDVLLLESDAAEIEQIIENKQKAESEQLKLYGVVKSLKSKYTPEFEEWLSGFEIENNLYVVDDEQKNTKEEMHLLYREL